jgi:alkylhydroperoxidase family enzyme
VSSYLAPVEKPSGFMLRMGYWYTRRRFGTVPGPLSVFCARMPSSFTSFYGKVGKLDKKLVLPADLALVLREAVASVNRCLYCMDANRWNAIDRSPGLRPKLDELGNYADSALFSEQEQAALDYATELTRERRVSPETFERLSRHFGEREICEIVWLVASEHLYNLNNIGLDIGSAGLCEAVPEQERAARDARA